MRIRILSIATTLGVATLASAAYLHVAHPGLLFDRAGKGKQEEKTAPWKHDDWVARYTYPTGHFDPTWSAEAALAEQQMVTKAQPMGIKSYDKQRVPNSPLTLSPYQFTALGPMPENNTQQSYGSVSGRVNVIAIDPVDPTIAYIGTDGGGIWKTTNCCSLEAPPNNPVQWDVITDIPEIAGLSISDITIDPHDRNTIYAATGDLRFGNFSFGANGVLKSTDQGATWRLLGTEVFSPYYAPINGGFPQYQAIGKVVVDPNDARKIVVGTKTSVFFSYDAGENWAGPCYLNEFATGPNRQRQDVTGLIPVSNGDGTTRLYAAIGTRGNATPTQPDIGQNGANGVYRLDQIPGGGCPATGAWTLLDNGWPAGTASGNPTGTPGGTDIGRLELAVSPSQPETLYAMAASVSGSNVLGVWRSNDRGDTWTKTASTANVARCGSDSSSAGGGTQMWYDAGISVHPTDPETTFISGFDVYRSTNGGASYVDITCGWTTKPAGTLDHVHVDHHARAFLPGDGEKMLIGSDGGVYYTENSTAPFPSFRQLNETLNTIEFYFGDISSNFANSATPAIGAGAQDNGCSAVKFTGQPTGPVKWTSNCGGDGTTTKIEPINNAIWFNSSQYGSLARSLTYGNTMSGSFSTASASTGGTWGGAGDLASTIFAMSYDIYKWGELDAPDSGCSTAAGCNHMIAGTNRLWETVDMTNSNTTTMRSSWKARTPNLTKNSLILGSSNRSYINHVAYSFTDPTVAAVGTNDGNVQIVFGLGTAAAANCPATPSSDPNCAQAVNLTDDNRVLPNRPIFGVRFDPRSALTVYAAVGGFDQNTPGRPGHVFQATCADYGCSSFRWKDKSGNLPNIPVEQIMPNPNRPDQVFIGTDWGLYYTDDISVDSPTWYYFEGFPRVMVWDLAVDRGFTTLAAFTRSRGAWAWPLPDAAIGHGADLSVTQTGSATALAGGQATHVITVKNLGPNTANQVVLSSPTPAGVMLSSVSGDCTSLPCTIGSLGATASRTVTVTYSIPTGYDTATPLVGTSSVTSATEDPNLANNSASATTQLGGSADLGLTMSGPASAGAPGTISVTLTVSNAGPSPAQAVSVGNPTPAGLSFVSTTGDCTSAFPCALGTLAAGASKTIVATFSVPDGYAQPSVVNSASVSSTTDDPATANNTASATTTISHSADLSIAMQAPSSAIRGDTVTYAIAVTNNGPAAANAVSVANATPAGLVFVSNSGACATAFPCNLGTLASGSVKLISTTFRVPSDYAGASPFVATATVSSSTTDPVSANNSANASIAVGDSADVSITQSGTGAVTAGGTVAYTVTIANAGPSVASGVSVSHVDPAGLVAGAVTGDCTSLPCTIGSLAPGATRSFVVNYTVPSDYAGSNPVTHAASVSASTPDPNLSNNVYAAHTSVGNGADIAVVIDVPELVERGDRFTYTVSITNNGPSAAQGVQLNATLPTGVVFVGNAGDCSSAWPCPIGNLPAGATRTVQTTVCIPASHASNQPLRLAATGSSSTPDPYMGNNEGLAYAVLNLDTLFRNGFDSAPCN